MEPVRNVGWFIALFLIALAIALFFAIPSVIKAFVH